MTGSFGQQVDQAAKTKGPALGGPFCVCMVVAFVYTPAHPWLRVLLLALLFRPMAATHTLAGKAAVKVTRLAAGVFMA
jgi:hypothetical protein